MLSVLQSIPFAFEAVFLNTIAFEAMTWCIIPLVNSSLMLEVSSRNTSAHLLKIKNFH